MLFSLIVSSVLAAEPRDAGVFASGRVSAAFPSDYTGARTDVGVDLAGILKDGNALGLRLSCLRGEAAARPTFSPSFTWQYLVPVGTWFDVYPTAGLGFTIGRSPTDGTNEVRTQVQGGFGARLHLDTGRGGGLFVAPEMGVVTSRWAPYIALNVGALLPAGD